MLLFYTFFPFGGTIKKNILFCLYIFSETEEITAEAPVPENERKQGKQTFTFPQPWHTFLYVRLAPKSVKQNHFVASQIIPRGGGGEAKKF